MEVIEQAAQMQKIALDLRRKGLSIGLVPTMGCLHEGHLSLVRRARAECDRVFMSIFVNPLQFGLREDYSVYPREAQRDLGLARLEGVDHLFAPGADEMYPEPFTTRVEVGGVLAEKMCARSRPGHFSGAATVVMKLFQIMQPDRAYFGQKDLQQVLVIRQMARDLNLPLEVVSCPIIRDADGLAMSSRNLYLSAEERQAALNLPLALQAGRDLILKGERREAAVRETIVQRLRSCEAVRVDYVEVCDGHTLAGFSELAGPVLLAAAVWVGKTRLIDNICLEV